MSINLNSATLKSKSFFSKLWITDEGLIKINYFSSTRNQSGNVKRSNPLKRLYYQYIVPHVFLGILIFVLLFIPRKLLAHKHFFKALQEIIKRCFDLIGSLTALILTSLVFIILPVLIKLDSKGSILYQQFRIGKNCRKRERRAVSISVEVERRKMSRRKADCLGKPFKVYKFRSMKQNAEKTTGPVWEIDNDPRVTKLGKFMRPYHLDEFPQFINILKGDMSLVGPRPERPEFTSQLETTIPQYKRRFDAKPGLTGPAQISCGYDRSIEGVNEKLKYDLQYIESNGIKKDCKIIWDTVKKIVSTHDNSS